MDHETAIALQAAERYCAGALSDEERDMFEEHFFMCGECAEEVRWEKIFAANARKTLEEEFRQPQFFVEFRPPYPSPLEVNRQSRFFSIVLPALNASSAWDCEIYDSLGGRCVNRSLGYPPCWSAEYHIAIPLIKLQPGEYTLVIRCAGDEITRMTFRLVG